jgi:hypothetical protein
VVPSERRRSSAPVVRDRALEGVRAADPRVKAARPRLTGRELATLARVDARSHALVAWVDDDLSSLVVRLFVDTTQEDRSCRQ